MTAFKNTESVLSKNPSQFFNEMQQFISRSKSECIDEVLDRTLFRSRLKIMPKKKENK